MNHPHIIIGSNALTRGSPGHARCRCHGTPLCSGSERCVSFHSKLPELTTDPFPPSLPPSPFTSLLPSNHSVYAQRVRLGLGKRFVKAVIITPKWAPQHSSELTVKAEKQLITPVSASFLLCAPHCPRSLRLLLSPPLPTQKQFKRMWRVMGVTWKECSKASTVNPLWHSAIILCPTEN